MEKEDYRKPKDNFWIFIFTFLIIGGSIVIGATYYVGLDDERVIVEGKIVDVDIIEDEVGYDTMILTFDNGESYWVSNTLGVDVDLTVNSKFIIKLYRDCPESDWEIKQIYRVPD